MSSQLCLVDVRSSCHVSDKPLTSHLAKTETSTHLWNHSCSCRTSCNFICRFSV